MTDSPEPKRSIVDFRSLSKDFPTHRHSDDFWEELGRTVATFGFLEETLGKAIFSFTATRDVPDSDFDVEYAKWILTLEKALSDPLGGLIDSYGKAVRSNTCATISNLDVLLTALRDASTVRNVLCHGSWRAPDAEGRSIPLFVNKKNEVYDGAIDVAFLRQVRANAVELICGVMNTVTHMGWRFPGSSGPGAPILVFDKS